MGLASRYSGLQLVPDVATALVAVLPRMAERTVAAIIDEVPAYADPFRGRMGQNIENAVQTSLGAFLRLATRGGSRTLNCRVLWTGHTSWAGERPAKAARSTHCWPHTGWAREWRGRSCR